MSEFPSGNVGRDAGLIAIVKEAQAAGEPITAANISFNCSQRFGQSFTDVSEIELAECVAYIAPPAEVQPEPEAQPVAVVEQREPPTMSREDANVAVQNAERALFYARRGLADAVTAQKAARGALSQAVMTWQRGGTPQPTREQLQRDYIASEQQRKMNGIITRQMPKGGPSVIDQHAAYSAGGDANQFARKQMKFGSHHRATFINGQWQRPRQRGTKIVPSEG